MRRLRGRVLKDVRRSHNAGRKNAGTGIPGRAGAGRAATTKPPSLTPAATSKTPNAYANSIMQSNSQKSPSPPHCPQSPRHHATESSKRAAKVPKNRQAGASGKEVRDGTEPDNARKLGCEYRFGQRRSNERKVFRPSVPTSSGKSKRQVLPGRGMRPPGRLGMHDADHRHLKWERPTRHPGPRIRGLRQ